MFIVKKHEYKAERYFYRFPLIICEGHIIITPLLTPDGAYIQGENYINLRFSEYIVNLVQLLPSLFRYYPLHDLVRCPSPSSEATSSGFYFTPVASVGQLLSQLVTLFIVSSILTTHNYQILHL